MKKSAVLSMVLFLVVLSAVPAFCKEKEVKIKMGKDIVLEQVDHSKGKPLMQTLKDRRSAKEFADRSLDMPTLSELLWAAGGITREDGRRTNPTAMNSQEIDIYVFMKEGVYLYDAKENTLKFVLKGDKRAETGKQDYVASAAVNLVYVSNLDKMKGEDANQKMLMSAIDLGHISQSVYLYCASAELSCVVRGYVDGAAVSKLLNLQESAKVIISQSVGYSK